MADLSMFCSILVSRMFAFISVFGNFCFLKTLLENTKDKIIEEGGNPKYMK